MSALEKHNELVMEVVGATAQSANEDFSEWKSLSLVVNLANGRNSRHGFVCFSEDKCDGFSGPFGSEFASKLVELRDKMAEDENRTWHKALIQITRADMNFSIDFEYDDPKRWDMDIPGMISGDYPMSLRPKTS